MQLQEAGELSETDFYSRYLYKVSSDYLSSGRPVAVERRLVF
jgi:hypothetical protein